MIWFFLALMGFFYFGIGMATSLAVAAAGQNQWKVAFKRGAVAVGGFAAAVFGLSALSTIYVMRTVDGTELRPGEKARVLAETISTLMNFGSLGLLAGLVAGVAVALRRRGKE